MSTFNPRKQTVIISLFCIAAVVAVSLYTYSKTSQRNALVGKNTSIESLPSADAVLSANDDWKKAFISSTSTPIKKGDVTATAGTGLSDTLTAQFGRQFFTQYVNLKQSGLIDDPEVVDSITNSLLSQEFLNPDREVVYGFVDIVISPNESDSALREYGNKIGFILKTYTPEKSDAYIAYTGIQKGNTSYIKELDSNIAKYKTMVAQLLKVPTPSSVSQNHLDLINGINGLSSIAFALKSMGSDPLLGMVELSTFDDTATLLASGMNSIKSAIFSAGISYSSSEGGSYFDFSNQ